MEISTFRNFRSKKPGSSTLEAIAEYIRTDRSLAQITALYRQSGSKTIKGESPLFAVAATFSGGKARADIIGITGLSLVDIDHVPVERLAEIRAKAIADPHTLLLYTTISGLGLRIIYRYESHESHSLKQRVSFYPKAFAVGNHYFSRLLGIEPDGQCKNITRLSGLAYDPRAYFNPDATAFTAAECEAAWDRVAASARETRLENRIANFYNKVIKPRLNAEGVVYAPGSHNKYVMRVGYMLAEKRYDRHAAIGWARAQFSDYDGTEQVLKSCFDTVANGSGDSQRQSARHQQMASVDDIKAFLDEHIRLRFNVITRRVECACENSPQAKWQPVTDRVVNSLWSSMSENQRVNVCDVFRVIESDYVKPFHPFAHYLEQLPPWHEGDRDFIADLAATVTVKNDDTSSGGAPSRLTFDYALRRWLVGMVAAWIDDTVVNNVILVLIGEQGAYKTTWFNYLLPPELRRYFYTKTNAGRMSKDDLLTLAQYALVCCEELDTMRPAELNQLKAAVTMTSIDERAAYARFHEHRRHIASFCGTGNNTMFLSDPTGSRRWLPFEVERIVSPRERPFPYEGIYAQALALYRGGFRFWFTSEEIMMQNRHNRHFEIPNMELELVSLYFRRPQPHETPMFMTSARAMQVIGGGVSQKLNATRIGMAFSELGFERARQNGIRGFLVIMRTAEEMMLYQKNI